MRKWQKIEKIRFDILKDQNLLFPNVSSDFLYFHSFTSKNCLQVSHFCRNVNCAKVVKFKTMFRGEGVEIGKIWLHGWKEEILNFQNVKSDFLYLMSVSHKLKSNLANFRTKFGPFSFSPILAFRDQFWEK